MRLACLAGAVGIVTSHLGAQVATPEAQVRRTVEAFYAAFNAHDFSRAADITTAEWVHINPAGGWQRGRAAVLRELASVHATFLHDVTDTPDSVVVRFASSTVAVATVPSRVTTYTTPDGMRHENEHQIRTFILVRRGSKWLIMQDQNTIRGR